jgi:hypothetical protein
MAVRDGPKAHLGGPWPRPRSRTTGGSATDTCRARETSAPRTRPHPQVRLPPRARPATSKRRRNPSTRGTAGASRRREGEISGLHASTTTRPDPDPDPDPISSEIAMADGRCCTFLEILLAIILPPLGVFLRFGCCRVSPPLPLARGLNPWFDALCARLLAGTCSSISSLASWFHNQFAPRVWLASG